MGNMSKPRKRLCSLLLILVMVIVMLPVSLSAEEGEEQTEEQVTSEIESDSEISTESESESEAAAQGESELSEPTETTQSEESELQGGSISGLLWYDENYNGIYDDGETGILSYPVYLYKADDTDNAVQTVATDENGEYAFTDIESGIYVVGVKSNELGTDYYLLPVVGVNGNNKLGTWSDGWDEKYSDAITIDTNSTVSNIDGGLRTPPGIQSTTAYTINVGSTVTAQTGYTVSSNLITFNTNASSHTYTISGTATNTYRIVIPSGVTVNITLSTCSITHATYSPILVNGTLNLTLTGSNTTTMSGEGQTTSYYTAGIYVDSSATLTITSSSTGTLSATGGSYQGTWWSGGAGIGGGSYSSSCASNGTINITGGTITATGGGTASSTNALGGAGIGGGAGANATEGGAGGVIKISGGTVIATGGGTNNGSSSGLGGAGIGGGYGGAGGTIRINNGIVTATGGGTSSGAIYGGAGIGGGGYMGLGGSIYLQGGTVTASGGTATVAGYEPYAIGGGRASSSSFLATVVEISSSVDLTAYSQSSAYPAIGSSSITGTGYVVNGYITNRTTDTAISSLQITLDTTPSGKTLTVPVGYSGIAYSTGTSSATDNIWVKNTSGTVIGAIAYNSNSVLDIQPTSAVATGQALKFVSTPNIGTLTAENVSKTTSDIKSTGFSFIVTSSSNVGYYYLATNTGFTSNNQIHTWSSTTTDPYIWYVTNLNSNTQYYYKSELTNSIGTITSYTKSFITLPDVSSWSVTPTGPTTATVSGTIVDNSANTANITSVTVYVNTTNNKATATAYTLASSDFTNTSFSFNITGLTSSTDYYAWVDVSNATTYNSEAIGGTTTVGSASFRTGYIVTEKYRDEAGNLIAADTTDIVVSPFNYSFSGSTAPITTGGYYRYKGYKFDSYTAGDTLDGTSPSIPNTTLTGNRTVYLVYENLNNMINITVPSSFYWYADETTETSTPGEYAIESGSYSIINNSTELNLTVELNAYAYTPFGATFSSVSTSDITLNLTEDLNETPIGSNLFNGASPTGIYTNILYSTNYMGGIISPGDKGTWKFGFDGTYTGSLPSSGELADFTVGLTFSVDSTTP